MVETRGIKRARDLRERQSSGQLEVSQYYTKTYQRRVSRNRGGGRKISQHQLRSLPGKVHLIIPHMLNGNHMHCNIGAYSRNSEIRYIIHTSHTLVSGHTLMLTAMAYLCTCDRYGNNISYYHRSDLDRFGPARDNICIGCHMPSDAKGDCG